MCERREAIETVSQAALRLERTCRQLMGPRRRNGHPRLPLISEPSTVHCLPAPPSDFNELMDRLGKME